VVLYSVVGVETAMLVSGSMVFMVLTFMAVVLIAGAICAWMFRLLDDGAPAPVAVERVAEPAPERAAPQPAPKLILT
jgi:uncharacterized iron-regulated membrane protein